MRRELAFIAVIALAAGCTPQNATITEGSYVTFLASETSPAILAEEIDFPDDARAVDCRRLDEGEVRAEGADSSICEDERWPPEHESWLRRDGFRVLEDQLEPWRGEAVWTAENDLQLTFHQRLPGGEDFRFAFVVDPSFQPTTCQQTEDGGVAAVPVDGDWLANWSNDADGTLFFLNAYAYQFNPADTSEAWSFPNEWAAGYTTAKLASEDFFARTVRYALPKVYSRYEEGSSQDPMRTELFYAGAEEGADPATSAQYQQEIDRVNDVADEIGAELELVGVDFMRPRVHTNEWRTPDGREAGLDNWVELHQNWVRFDPGFEFEVGGSGTGEFFLTYDAGESQSRLYVHGTFAVDGIKKDRWTTRDVMAEKLEENGTQLCGEDFTDE